MHTVNNEMNIYEMLALCAAASAAGLVNAVAGGGTLITFPALLALGTPSIIANATSTLALVIGTAGSLFGYRRQMTAIKPWLVRFVPVSLAGGLLGGVLLTTTGEQVFSELVPFLLLFATLLFVAQNAFGRMAGLDAGPPAKTAARSHAVWLGVGFQFFVALYGGYFGAGIGILMLASLGYLGLTNIHEMNALKTVLGSLINAVAAAYFIYAGLIDWPRTVVMTVGALAGYFLGAHFSQRISQSRVRQIITAIGFLISAALFYRRFGP